VKMLARGYQAERGDPADQCAADPVGETGDGRNGNPVSVTLCPTEREFRTGVGELLGDVVVDGVRRGVLDDGRGEILLADVRIYSGAGGFGSGRTKPQDHEISTRWRCLPSGTRVVLLCLRGAVPCESGSGRILAIEPSWR
jgi:hypothetical protein